MIGDNLLLLDFQSIADRKHAMWDDLWSFFKDMIVFEDSIGLEKPTYMVFDEVSIWLQCHSVPLAFLHAFIILSVGERI